MCNNYKPIPGDNHAEYKISVANSQSFCNDHLVEFYWVEKHLSMTLPAIINKVKKESEKALLNDYLNETNANLILMDKYLKAPSKHCNDLLKVMSGGNEFVAIMNA